MNLLHGNAFKTVSYIELHHTMKKRGTDTHKIPHSHYSKKPTNRIKINDNYGSQHSQVLPK